MLDPLIRKLEYLGLRSPERRAAVSRLCVPRRVVTGRRDISTEDRRAGEVNVVLEGVACRYKVMPDGKRQIIAFVLPGDFCDLPALVQMAMDHNVAALTNCSIGIISVEALRAEADKYAEVRDALWRDAFIDAAICREWVANVGRRTARERMAHLFCEIACRMDAVGLKTSRGFIFDVTQVELGDALGLSVVHVNRTLQQLRGEKLVQFDSHKMVIENWERMAEIAGFDGAYLRSISSREIVVRTKAKA